MCQQAERRAPGYPDGAKVKWRRVWDSNPRIHHCITRFRIERLKPDSANPPGSLAAGGKLAKRVPGSSALWPFFHLPLECSGFRWPTSPSLSRTGSPPVAGRPSLFRKIAGNIISMGIRDYCMPLRDLEKLSRFGWARLPKLSRAVNLPGTVRSFGSPRSGPLRMIPSRPSDSLCQILD